MKEATLSTRLDRLRTLWWEWSDASRDPQQRLPTVIQFPINDICNSKCQMCHIWERKRDHDVTAAELAKILSNDLFREVREIGINGGEPTLRKDLSELVRAAIEKLPKLRGVSLITNAIQESQVLRAADDLGRVCGDAGIHLDVMVSIDGVADVHDRVRGVAGNFASADRVIDQLLQSPRVGSCRIGCTLIRENIYDAERVLAYARSKPVYARFRVGIPHRRLYTTDVHEPFALDESERYHLACFLDELRLNYELDPARRAFYLSLRNQIIYGTARAAGCAWKNRGITLTSRGELAYCAVQSPILGSLLEKPADQLYWSNAQVLKTIREDHCASCLHDYDGVEDRQILYERVLRKRLPQLPLTAARTLRRAKREWSDRRRDVTSRTSTAQVSPGAALRNAILLCGWYGTETLGDKAILAGLIQSLRTAGWNGAIDLASLEPYVSVQTLREMPELGVREILTVPAARSAVAQRRYHSVVIAGGPLMSPVAEIFDLLALFTDAAASETGRAILGCGIGPLGTSERRDAAIAQLLKLSEKTVLRDQTSRDTARTHLGFARQADVAPDPAFIWAADQRRTNPPRKEDTVLLALRDWPIQEYAQDIPAEEAAAIKARFEREVIEMVHELQRCAPELKLRPVPMHTHARGGDDRMFFQRLFGGIPGFAESWSWKRTKPAEQFAEFRAARAVVAMRFHSVVLSIAARTPFVAIDYTRGGKIAALLESIGDCGPPLKVDMFSGRDAAARILAATKTSAGEPPENTGGIYTAAWQAVLSRKTHG
jgi:polysaccharide pyruvyl transferase WcaK-like protein/MoaA/NifB/PqqE/SkfB family radical SAM enzyme